MQDRVFKLLLEEDEVTWQTILYSLVKDEGMDPWDVDVSLLSQKYIDTVRAMKKTDFRMSGKVVLAAAILLKLKSTRFVEEDIMELDRLISSTEDMSSEEFYNELEQLQARPQTEGEMKKLIPRTPQPRKRKVSVYDLVNALEQALEVKKRRVERSIPASQFEYDPIKMDVGLMIRQTYHKILSFFKLGKKQIFYHNLLPPEAKKQDKVMTFLPLLHLTNQRKLDLEQQEHFGDIKIYLKKNKKSVKNDLGVV
ncbi:MAG: segregation/condensation protein A [Candidatus Woesearchaeota archaeon]|jgi:segregation and condensation protein A|nr:segregation/condensation protein A [Candidatus Woesearchaeota archaeon]MDP7458474.1 segregation/condensation protein A [Candidatus Woesearchaeota archaeon]